MELRNVGRVDISDSILNNVIVYPLDWLSRVIFNLFFHLIRYCITVNKVLFCSMVMILFLKKMKRHANIEWKFRLFYLGIFKVYIWSWDFLYHGFIPRYWNVSTFFGTLVIGFFSSEICALFATCLYYYFIKYRIQWERARQIDEMLTREIFLCFSLYIIMYL